jgi:hypothetical protein
MVVIKAFNMLFEYSERKYSTELLNALSVTWYQLVYDLYPCFIVSSRLNFSLGLELLSINIYILNVFAFFGDAGVTYLVKCRKYLMSVQKETMECGFDRKKSVTDIHCDTSNMSTHSDTSISKKCKNV